VAFLVVIWGGRWRGGETEMGRRRKTGFVMTKKEWDEVKGGDGMVCRRRKRSFGKYNHIARTIVVTPG